MLFIFLLVLSTGTFETLLTSACRHPTQATAQCTCTHMEISVDRNVTHYNLRIAVYIFKIRNLEQKWPPFPIFIVNNQLRIYAIIQKLLIGVWKQYCNRKILEIIYLNSITAWVVMFVDSKNNLLSFHCIYPICIVPTNVLFCYIVIWSGS